MASQGGDDPAPAEELFPVFMVSMLSMVVVPWTLSKLLKSRNQEQKATGGKAKGKPLSESLRETPNIILGVLWVILILLSLYVSRVATEEEVFDPFEILGVPTSADVRTIKSAYRKLSLKYHPDKNPDPAAAVYFADYVSKAYKTLTDDDARENWKQYGHPDGPRSTKLGVALPNFLFEKDYGVWLLGGMVALGILLPICYCIFFLRKSKKYTANNVIVDTISIWGHPNSPVSIKQAHSVHRILETFTCAAEFVDLKVDSRERQVVEYMWKELKHVKAITDEAKLTKRRVGFVKAYLILLCHMHRIEWPPAGVPASAVAVTEHDKQMVLKETPRLMSELFKVSAMPRVRPFRYGWHAPAEAVIECLQCITQAISTDVKKPRGGGGNADGTNVASLLQLPHVTDSVVRKLSKAQRGGGDGSDGKGEGDRQNHRIKSVRDLQNMGDTKCGEALVAAGLSESKSKETVMAVKAHPTIHMTAELFVDGEDEICVFDPLTCKVKLMLTRPNHKNAKEVPRLRDKSLQASAPRYPCGRSEKWYILVSDQKTNLLMAWCPVDMAEAEECGYSREVNGDGDGDDNYQVATLTFISPPPGNYDVSISCMSDCWIGSDVTLSKKMKVLAKPTKPRDGDTNSEASSDTRVNAPSEKKPKGDRDAKDGSDASDDDSGSDDDSESEVLSDFSYDSDETGTDIDDDDLNSETSSWIVQPKLDETKKNK